MKNFFNPEDFLPWGLDDTWSKVAAKEANAKLNKEIEKWPVVYAKSIFNGWNEDSSREGTHTARLTFVEEIKPKECDHIPQYTDKYSAFICAKPECGKKLKATWSVVDE